VRLKCHAICGMGGEYWVGSGSGFQNSLGSQYGKISGFEQDLLKVSKLSSQNSEASKSTNQSLDHRSPCSRQNKTVHERVAAE